MKRRFTMTSAIAIGIALVAASPMHIELVSSTPSADTVLTTAPQDLVLTFSTDLDFERSAATMRSASGNAVKLGKPETTSDPRQMKLVIEDQLAAGAYTVTWTAAPRDDHGGRGRFSFEIGQSR